MVTTRSGCPINLALEALGDRWSLIVIRDIMFGNSRHFRELLSRSEEGIATNILADRLKRLVAQGILSRRDDPTHKQKAVYSLTDQGIALLPVLIQLGTWGRRYLPTTPELAIRQKLLEDGGASLRDRFMAELRSIHLGTELPEGQRSVLETLGEAFEQVRAASSEQSKHSR